MTNVKDKQERPIKRIFSLILALIIIAVSSYFGIDIGEYLPHESANGELILTMIDVGQADSFLLQQDGKVALIDCGKQDTVENVKEYLLTLGITKLDYVIGTHPHEDHMGGMYEIITNFEVGEIVIPEVTKNEVRSTWYRKLQRELNNESKNYNVVYPEVGDVIELGYATMTLLGPKEEPEEELNNYSFVYKVTFGEMDIIMTGDAEKEVERELLEAGVDLDAEILKLGHHGSYTSTSKEFLEAVSPDYALISSNVNGNTYSHPAESTIKRLEKEGIVVYRTDESGTVVATITSDSVQFDAEPGSYESGKEKKAGVE